MTDTQTGILAEPQAGTRAGFVALIGEPNAGKSTLLNRMVGAKVSIVTHKVQTTRARMLGIALHELAGVPVQMILVDTPGIFAPKRRLDRAMVAAAWNSLDQAEAILVMIDAAAKLGERGLRRTCRIAPEQWIDWMTSYSSDAKAQRVWP